MQVLSRQSDRAGTAWLLLLLLLFDCVVLFLPHDTNIHSALGSSRNCIDNSSSRMAADCAIVGAAGFLGRRLTETLESLGSTCVRLDVVVEEEGIVGCDLSSPRCFPQLVRSVQGVRCVFLVASYGMVGTDLDLDVRLPPRAPTLTLAHSLRTFARAARSS